MTSEITTLYSSRDNRVIITIKPGVEQVKYSDHDLIRVRAIGSSDGDSHNGGSPLRPGISDSLGIGD